MGKCPVCKHKIDYLDLRQVVDYRAYVVDGKLAYLNFSGNDAKGFMCPKCETLVALCEKEAEDILKSGIKKKTP